MYLVVIINWAIKSVYPTIAVADQATSNILKSDRLHRAWSHPPIEVQVHSEKSTISGKPNIPQLFQVS